MIIASLGQLTIIGDVIPNQTATQAINDGLQAVPPDWFDQFNGTVEFKCNNHLNGIAGQYDGINHIWCEFTPQTLTHEIAHTVYQKEARFWSSQKQILFNELKDQYLQIDSERMRWYYINEPYSIDSECFAEMASIYYTKPLNNYPIDFINKLEKFFNLE